MKSDLSSTIRTFIALELPEPVRAAVARVQRDLVSSLAGNVVRWTPPEQIHLTLRFLGNVPAAAVPEIEAALQRACVGIAPFALAAAGAGTFPEAGRPRVVWIGLDGDLASLRRLAQQIDFETASWGEPPDRDFHPHLTLGRVKDARPSEQRRIGQALSRIRVGRLANWQVDYVAFLRSELSSEGAKHTRLSMVTLTTPEAA